MPKLSKTEDFMFQNVAYRPTVYKTGIFPNVNDALKDKDIFPMDIETMDLLLNVAVVGSQLFDEYFNPKRKCLNSKFRKGLAKKWGIFKPDRIISFAHNCAGNTYTQHNRKFNLLQRNGLMSEI